MLRWLYAHPTELSEGRRPIRGRGPQAVRPSCPKGGWILQLLIVSDERDRNMTILFPVAIQKRRYLVSGRLDGPRATRVRLWQAARAALNPGRKGRGAPRVVPRRLPCIARRFRVQNFPKPPAGRRQAEKARYRRRRTKTSHHPKRIAKIRIRICTSVRQNNSCYGFLARFLIRILEITRTRWVMVCVVVTRLKRRSGSAEQ